MWESLLAWLKERTASPLYGTYIISNVLCNWKFYYTLFFQDQSALSDPKIEYIENTFLSGNQFLHTVWFFLPSILLTVIIIRFMPYFTNWAYDISIKEDFKRRLSYDIQKLEYERRQKRMLDEFLEIKQEKAATQERIKEITSEEDRWDIEYNEFKKIKTFTKFGEVIKTIYNGDGNINYGKTNTGLDGEILAVTDSRGLISYLAEYSIRLTEKGKYFVKRFFEDGYTIDEVPF